MVWPGRTDVEHHPVVHKDVGPDLGDIQGNAGGFSFARSRMLLVLHLAILLCPLSDSAAAPFHCNCAVNAPGTTFIMSPRRYSSGITRSITPQLPVISLSMPCTDCGTNGCLIATLVPMLCSSDAHLYLMDKRMH